MPADTYRFTVGKFECLAVNDGTYYYTAAQYFANAPADVLARGHVVHHLEEVLLHDGPQTTRTGATRGRRMRASPSRTVTREVTPLRATFSFAFRMESASISMATA